jgi:hypothetical protein
MTDKEGILQSGPWRARAMTYKELMQRLKAAKNTPEYIAVELDALAAARNGSITTPECDQLVGASRQMRKRVKDRLTIGEEG